MKKPARKSAGTLADALDAMSYRPFGTVEKQPPRVVTAEEHARECEQAAASLTARAKEGGVKNYALLAAAEMKRSEGNNWRALLKTNGDTARAARRCEDEIEGNLAELLARLNTGDKGAAAALTTTMHRLLSGLETLAAKGDALAAELMLELADAATARFYTSAHAQPALFTPHTRRKLQIPAPIGRTKETIEGAKAFAAKMEVGTGSIFPGKRWAIGKNKFRLVFKLLAHIEKTRTFLPVYRLTAEETGSQLPAWTADGAKLGPFNARTWREWADVAWTILASESKSGKASQHPAIIAEPICNVRRERIDPDYQNVVKAPSIADNDVKEAVFDAFHYLATGKSKTRKGKTR